ncbi:uncharacterized protein [Solanum lycopersicum]|uniref:uncharacterized protein n=1 Tax=Solanum lycopersicum TaxID=4081 RepID=UPI003749DC35
MADRLRDFTRMNPPIFTGAKTSEDPQEFIDEVHKILVAMGATDNEKLELASYQLKDVAQTWCKMWQDSRVLGGVPVTWELFQTIFLEKFFPREMREAKVEEFINLKQGSMTVKEYSLKFVKLSRYATSLVSNSRDEMSRFLTGINGDLEEECRSAMLHDNMDLSRLMPKFKKGQKSSRNSNPQRNTTPRGCSPQPKRDNVCDMQLQRRPVLSVADITVENEERELMPSSVVVKVDTWSETVPRTEVRLEVMLNLGLPQQSAAAAEPPKKKRFYALKGREELEKSADVVTSMLQVFSTSVYALLDPGSTLSFVTPLLVPTFETLPEVLHDPIVVSTPLGENVRTDRVYKNCRIVVSG